MALSHLGGQRIWESLIVNGYGRGLWASEKVISYCVCSPEHTTQGREMGRTAAALSLMALSICDCS